MTFPAYGQPEHLPDITSPRPDPQSWWWQHACDTARSLRAGNPAPVTNIYGPLMNPDEQGRVSAELTYSRLYGTTVSYRRSGFFAFGSLPIMIGAMGANELINQSRKTSAQQQAAVQWRETQPATVAVTTERLLCHVNRGWLRFPLSSVTDFTPDLDTWSVTVGFGGQTSPVGLVGPPAPAVALWIAHALLGPGWINDPRLQRLQ